MLLKGCLNGSRTVAEHAGVPVTPAELAADARRAVAAGAGALHLHPRSEDGAETLEAGACAAALRAVRAACPGIPVGLTTGQWIEGTPDGRLAAVRGWTELPDFVSVNLSEDGVPELCAELGGRGVGLEAGLAGPGDVERLAGLIGDGVRWLRLLVEIDGIDGIDDDAGAAVDAAAGIDAALDRAGRPEPRLHHGAGQATWAVLEAAVRAGRDIRIGLEDTLVLPDGRPASGNAELVATAAGLLGSAHG